MVRRPPSLTHTDTSFIFTTLFRSNSQKRSVAMLEPVFGVLAWCVDEDLMDVPIDIGELGDCFDIARLCEFADPRAFPEMPSGIREGVARYLAGLPGYFEEFIWRSEERRVGQECGRTCRYRGSPEHTN